MCHRRTDLACAGLPPAFFQAVYEGQEHLPPSLLTTIGLVLVGNLALLIAVLRGDPIRLLYSRVFFAVDLGVAAGLNLWASVAIPQGILYQPYQDPFAVYGWDTMVLWTAIRGPATGLLVCVGVVGPLQLGMASLNGLTLATIRWGALVERDLWVLAHLVITTIVTLVAREVAWATTAAGLRAGRETARAEMLRALHDTVLQTLEAITLRAGPAQVPADQRLVEIQTTARQQAAELRGVLHRNVVREHGTLAETLHVLAQEFLGHGLQVKLVTTTLTTQPPAPVTQALVGATREALTNTLKHAKTDRVVVRAATRPTAIEITIRDHVCGFDSDSTPGYGALRT